MKFFPKVDTFVLEQGINHHRFAYSVADTGKQPNLEKVHKYTAETH